MKAAFLQLAATSSSKRFREALSRGISDVTNLERQSGAVLGPADLCRIEVLKGDAHRQLSTSLEPGAAPDGAQLSRALLCYWSGAEKGAAGGGSGDVAESIARASLKLALLCNDLLQVCFCGLEAIYWVRWFTAVGLGLENDY